MGIAWALRPDPLAPLFDCCPPKGKKRCQSDNSGSILASSKQDFTARLSRRLQPDGQRRKHMQRWILRTCILAGCFSLASLSATAQEVVHALVGTVISISPAAKTVTVKTDDGSNGVFKDMTNSNTKIEFDKSIRSDATAADEFKKSGARAIIYYFGIGDMRTVVALRSLGPGPFTKSSGTVVDFDDGKHSFSIKNSSGAVESFQITSTTVVETGMGAKEGFYFQPGKGDQVRVNATVINGSTTALFINTMIAN